MSVKKASAFSQWIDAKSVKGLARTLNVQKSTVRYWRLGKTVPRPGQMKKIVQLSRGRVTYRAMIEHHLNNVK